MGTPIQVARKASKRFVRKDDRIDHLHSVWTVSLLVVLSTVVSSSQLVGQPINCWCPNHFSSSDVAYTNSYCWTKNTYYIPMNASIPVDQEGRKSEELNYYQWVPLVLLLQALGFKLPDLLWRLGKATCGINLDEIGNLAERSNCCSVEEREKISRLLYNHLTRWLTNCHRFDHYDRTKGCIRYVCCNLFSKCCGIYLTFLYVITKMLYWMNVSFQFLFLGSFLDVPDTFQVMSELVVGSQNSTVFPLITLCDFKIRQLQNLQTYTVQCVLPINLFNEKIFTIVLYWILLVAILTLCNLILWIVRLYSCDGGYPYIKKYLKTLDALPTRFDKTLCKKFTKEYLQHDGVFVIRHIAQQSSELVALDLVDKLWRMYKHQRRMVRQEMETEQTMETGNVAESQEQEDLL